MNHSDIFTEEQKEYLAGFATGSGLFASNEKAREPVHTASPTLSQATVVGPDRLLMEAQQETVSRGGKLVNEELAKGEKHPLDRWDELEARAKAEKFPSGVDVFLAKTFGIFYVAPAQNSYMCRLRFAGGSITSHQLAGIANIADECAGGYAHVTTRANLQLREIPVSKPPEVLSRLTDLGVLTRGSGADNIRNITASPTAGFDEQEWYNTLPLAKQMQQYISNHREMYHLPRKFNIAFDGGGIITTLADTNDIGFRVVRVSDQRATEDVAAGTYFRIQLAGITGHKQFASDCGWVVEPHQCVQTAAAIIRVFIRYGNRTDRRKARLKYLIDDWGVARFLQAVREELPFEPVIFPLVQCELPPAPIPASHIGFRNYGADKCYVGIATPVGYMSSADMRFIAHLANRYGDGQLRLTCWQNVIIPSMDRSDIELVKKELQDAGLSSNPHPVRAGLVACTGNSGCKFAASDTKRHALQIAERVEQRVELDQPVNIHVTGCHHSCAQHYIGDIGLIAAKVEVPLVQIQGTSAVVTRGESHEELDETQEVEGYHLIVGGGFGHRQGIGRELLHELPASEVPQVVEQVLAGYMQHRGEGESFVEFTRRFEVHELRELLGLAEPAGAP
ncbi:MAG: NirA family protein [Pirellulaceae bacterium]|nr:NirA family protein [Pirellulaceae bacterium]